MSPGRSTALLSSTGSPRFVPRQFCPDQRSPTKDQADQGRLKYLVSRSPPVWPHRKGATAAGKRLQNCKKEKAVKILWSFFTGTLNTVLGVCCLWCCCSSCWHCVALPDGWWGGVDVVVVLHLLLLDFVLHYQVVGGVAADEFLASVEQLDSSNKQDVLYQVDNQISYFSFLDFLTELLFSESGGWWLRRSRSPDMTLQWHIFLPAGIILYYICITIYVIFLPAGSHHKLWFISHHKLWFITAIDNGQINLWTFQARHKRDMQEKSLGSNILTTFTVQIEQLMIPTGLPSW